MTRMDLIALLPFLIVVAASVVVMLVVAFYRNHKAAAALTVTGLMMALISLPFLASITPHPLAPIMILDDYALFFIGLILGASLTVAILAYGYLGKQTIQREEFYILLLTAALGCAVLAASTHFVSFFLGLETLSISLFALMAYLHTEERSIEAGIKYLILTSVSTSFLLFGMALVYGATGTMQLAPLASLAGTMPHSPLLMTGMAMIVIGVGFKLAVVPFHMWTPDVYEGAPAPVTAFVATASKGAVFALLLRYTIALKIHQYDSLVLVLGLVAIASMLVGNLLALLQNNVKRILAYSSIAHLGYLLVALLAGGSMAAEAVMFYLAAYFVTMLGAFGIVTILSEGGRDAEWLEDYRGLSRRRPWCAAILTVMLLSLAGIPLTGGFVSKFYVLAAGAGSALWLLVIVLVISSTIGLFYYLRIVVAIYSHPAKHHAEEPAQGMPSLSTTGGIVLAVLAVLLIWLGVYPAPLIGLIRETIKGLI